METKANHVLIGAFTILVTVLAVLFALWAANYSSNKQWDKYEVVFSESVTGLGNGGADELVVYGTVNATLAAAWTATTGSSNAGTANLVAAGFAVNLVAATGANG